MKSIQSRFNKIQHKQPYWSDYICLAEAVRGQKFTRRRIYSHFRNLVNKTDYDDTDVNKLVRHLHKISNEVEECTFLDESVSESSKAGEDESNITMSNISPILIVREQVLL